MAHDIVAKIGVVSSVLRPGAGLSRNASWGGDPIAQQGSRNLVKSGGLEGWGLAVEIFNRDFVYPT